MEKHTYRDRLAKERTVLAEERTHLAYIRTGLSAVLAGIFFVGFFEEKFHFSAVGYIFILIGALLLAYGTYSHRKAKKIIKKINGSFQD